MVHYKRQISAFQFQISAEQTAVNGPGGSGACQQVKATKLPGTEEFREKTDAAIDRLFPTVAATLHKHLKATAQVSLCCCSAQLLDFVFVF